MVTWHRKGLKAIWILKKSRKHNFHACKKGQEEVRYNTVSLGTRSEGMRYNNKPSKGLIVLVFSTGSAGTRDTHLYLLPGIMISSHARDKQLSHALCIDSKMICLVGFTVLSKNKARGIIKK